MATPTISPSSRPEEIESLVLNGDSAGRIAELEAELAELMALLEEVTRPKVPRHVWKHSEAANALRDYQWRHGQTPTTRHAGKTFGLPSTSVTRRLFGGWNEALKTAGLVINRSGNGEACRERHLLRAAAAELDRHDGREGGNGSGHDENVHSL